MTEHQTSFSGVAMPSSHQGTDRLATLSPWAAAYSFGDAHVRAVEEYQKQLRVRNAARLDALEKQIENANGNLSTISTALMEISRQRLYEVHNLNFEQYCHGRLHISPRRARQLAAHARCAMDLAEMAVQPWSEAQTRLLARLSAEQRRQVWQYAVNLAGGRQPTAKLVREAICSVANPLPRLALDGPLERSRQISEWYDDLAPDLIAKFDDAWLELWRRFSIGEKKKILQLLRMKAEEWVDQ